MAIDEVQNDKELLIWLNEQIFNGYKPIIKIEELEEMIDIFVKWYEFKYPNREFELKNGFINRDFKNIDEMSKYMNYEQMLYRLSNRQLSLIKCRYRSIGGEHPYITVPIKKKEDSSFKSDRCISDLIKVNHLTGIVEQCDIENLGILTENEMLVDDLLNILNENENPNIEYEEIKQTVYLHQVDLELRKKVLELISLKLLYSPNTIPNYGYERAKKFIEELNIEIPNLNLSTEKIDTFINYDYHKSIENQKEKTEIIEPVVLKKTIFSKIFSKKIS